MRRFGWALALITLLAAGCSGGNDKTTKRGTATKAGSSSSAAPTQSATRPGRITSTLDGKRILPHRLRWIARPHVHGAISEVRFLIDGSVRWIEHEAPYVYGSDDAGANRGFLVTTWLTPGRHRFTVQAEDLHKTTYERTVTARVLPAPNPPAPLAGHWRRPVAGGHWDLIFDRIGAWHLDPEGSGVPNQVVISNTTIHVYAPIEMGPLTNDQTPIKRLGHANIGGFDCNPAGPFGTYRWHVSGDRLTLKPVHESCADRKGIWSHVWRRVGPVDAWRAPKL
jgi:hypothetical protein